MPIPPASSRKGRGALSNQAGRFETRTREDSCDGWEQPEEDALPPLETTVTADPARSIISRMSPFSSRQLSMNSPATKPLVRL